MALTRLALKAKVVRNSKVPTKLKFQGYSGGAVDLSDHGLDAQAVYNLETTEIKNQKVSMKYNHRTNVGQTTKIENTGSKIIGEGVLTAKNKITRKIENSVSEFPFEMSMGGDARKVKVSFFPEGTIVNNRKFSEETYVLDGYVIDEMTITESGRDASTYLRLNNSKLSRSDVAKIKKTPEKGVKIPKKIRLENGTPMAKKKRASTRSRRVENSGPKIKPGTLLRINNKYGSQHSEVIEKAANENWSRTRLLNAIKVRRLENRLKDAPIQTGKRGAADKNLLAARIANAVCQQPEETLEKHFGARIRDRAMSMPEIGIKEVLLNAAHSAGERGFNGHSDSTKLMSFVGRMNRGALINPQGRLNNAGGFSSFDMPNLFERTTSIVMEEAWKIGGFFAKEMCYKTTQTNFKKTQRFRPQGGQEWEGLDQDGKIKHANFGDEVSYETELDTKAQMLMITRVMVKNDDFGAIREMMELMAEGAKMVPDKKLVQRMLQANGSFFTAYAADTETGGAGTGNSVSGGDAALTETGLALAYDLASERTTSKGTVNWLDDIVDNWTIVVATKAQERAAWDIVGQKEVVGDTTANTKTKKDNYWYKRADIKRFPQLANKTFHASANRTNWFLWPSMPKYAPFAINWLDGVETPTIETVEAPVDQLGFGVRGYIDVDINDREPEAIVRMAAS